MQPIALHGDAAQPDITAVKTSPAPQFPRRRKPRRNRGGERARATAEIEHPTSVRGQPERERIELHNREKVELKWRGPKA